MVGIKTHSYNQGLPLVVNHCSYCTPLPITSDEDPEIFTSPLLKEARQPVPAETCGFRHATSGLHASCFILEQRILLYISMQTLLFFSNRHSAAAADPPEGCPDCCGGVSHQCGVSQALGTSRGPGKWRYASTCSVYTQYISKQTILCWACLCHEANKS